MYNVIFYTILILLVLINSNAQFMLIKSGIK